ncbi:hypothetical protein [Nocardia sp. NPDC049707]|uniref:hypothetical protein n=1 Tax=Nocardia sp. NPDC049707 TaxID=3154735 RepID=UPI0034316012
MIHNPEPDNRYRSCETPLIATDDILTDRGIIVRAPLGQKSAWDDGHGEIFKEIGRVTVDATGLVELWPYLGLGADEMAALRGFGIDALEQAPTRVGGWDQGTCTTRGLFWWCAMSVPVMTDAECDTIFRSTPQFHVDQDRAFFATYADDGATDQFGSAA